MNDNKQQYHSGSSYGREASREPWKLIVTLVVGFVLGFGSAWLWFNRPAGIDENIMSDGEETTQSGSDVPLPTDSGQPADEDLVFVKDQEAGAQVFLSRVALTRLGWVAIREDADGELGNILGAKLFDAGEYQGIVNLLRVTETGNMYHAVMYVDDGDRLFDHTKDLPVTDVSGALVSMQFEAY